MKLLPIHQTAAENQHFLDFLYFITEFIAKASEGLFIHNIQATPYSRIASTQKPITMLKKLTLLITCFLFFTHFAQAQTTHKKTFASRALIGLHFGAFRDWEGERDNRFEATNFWGPRAGISVTERLYAGIQARIIQARNFETPWQNFYMAGVWGRGYLLHPVIAGQSKRLGVFLESGFMMANYSFDNKDFRPGQWYIPVILGAELRLVQNLTVEGCLQGYYNSKSWDQHGIAYASIGLNYHLGN